MEGLTRRRLIEVLGLAGAGALVGRVPPGLATAATQHQPGIATALQAHLEFAAFDLTAATQKELRDLLRDWSSSATRLRKRHRDDRLTITFGFGPGLFDDRYGLATKKPASLNPLPPFFGDQLDPALSGGDLAVQICADSRDSAENVLTHLTGPVTQRWHLAGTRGGPPNKTPRNRMGFKDGTNNIAGDDRSAMRHSVWVSPRDNPAWLRGGTYLVARRIRMKLDDWNATPVARQERVIGRHKRSGAPLGATHEFDQADFDAGVKKGDPVIPTDAHIRLASPQANGGKLIRRRSYNYDEGLLFLAFQRNPRQFIAIQRRLAQNSDALGRFVVHEGSALFACPPAGSAGGFVGDTLLVR
jgi:deferrochelatase/peroxidase EfeB